MSLLWYSLFRRKANDINYIQTHNFKLLRLLTQVPLYGFMKDLHILDIVAIENIIWNDFQKLHEIKLLKSVLSVTREVIMGCTHLCKYFKGSLLRVNNSGMKVIMLVYYMKCRSVIASQLLCLPKIFPFHVLFNIICPALLQCLLCNIYDATVVLKHLAGLSHVSLDRSLALVEVLEMRRWQGRYGNWIRNRRIS